MTVPISWTGRKFGASLLKESSFGFGTGAKWLPRVKEVDAAGAVAAIAASNEAFRVWRSRQSRGPSPAAAGRGRSSSV